MMRLLRFSVLILFLSPAAHAASIGFGGPDVTPPIISFDTPVSDVVFGDDIVLSNFVVSDESGVGSVLAQFSDVFTSEIGFLAPFSGVIPFSAYGSVLSSPTGSLDVGILATDIFSNSATAGFRVNFAETAVVPLPASALLLLGAILALGGFRRSKRT